MSKTKYPKGPKRVNLEHARIGEHVVVRVAPGKYIFWSSIVDGPITYVCDEKETRKYMKACEVKAYGGMWREFFDRRWERLQSTGTTEMAFGPATAESAVSGNKAGPNYEQLTLDAITRMYWSEKAKKNFVLSEGDVIPWED